MIGREFKLVQIIDFYDTRLSKFDTSVALQINGRCVITTDLYNVECVEQYSCFIESKIKQEKKAKLKELLSPAYENLKTKKEVYAFIGKLIDEIKTESRGK